MSTQAGFTNPAVDSDRVSAPVVDARLLGDKPFGSGRGESALSINSKTSPVVGNLARESNGSDTGRLGESTPHQKSREVGCTYKLQRLEEVDDRKSRKEETAMECSPIKILQEMATTTQEKQVNQGGSNLNWDRNLERRNDQLERLGEKIQELKEFLKDKHNVHKTIKDMARSLGVTYKSLCSAEDDLLQCQRPGTIGKETQTTPSLRPKKAGKSEEPLTTPQDRSNKQEKEKKRPKETTWQEVVTRKAKKKEKQSSKEDKKVQNRTNKDKTKRARPTRPDALIIKAREGRSYVDILSKLRTAPSLNELGDSVNKIRKTVAGDLLIELKRTKEVKTADFQEAVKAVLVEGATVKALQQEETFEIRDLDILTSKEEVLEALQREIGGKDAIEITAVKSLRKAYGDTQIAVVQLSKEIASMFTKLEKIKIGWVNCRIRSSNRSKGPLRCYKCLGFGHVAIKCTDQQDRSKCCYRCGNAGHKANSCRNEPCCVLCHKKGDNSPTNHATGSYSCPAYQAAVKKIRK